MSHVAVLNDFFRLRRAERMDHGRLRALQDAKLRRLVDHSWRTAPFWRDVIERAGLRPGDIRSLDDLAHLPVTTRQTLQAQPIETITSGAFAADAVQVSMTSGTSGRPLTIRKDHAYARLRKSMFLRALRAGGYGPRDRMLLMVGTVRPKMPFWLGWRHIDKNLPAHEVLEQVRQFRPTVLYGPRTPLCQLARYVQDRGADFPRVRRIFTTAETADDLSTGLLEEQLGGRVFDIYGSHELGTVGFQCAARTGYHLSEDTTVVEFLPVETDSSSCRVVATNLELLATPLIRYDTGDLASAPMAEPCSCGRRLLRVPRFEGRLVDTITLPGGKLLSPYAITEAVEELTGLERYQVTQEALERYTFRVQGRVDDRDRTGRQIVEAVHGVVGDGAAVDVIWESRVEPPVGRKFRVVESRVTAEMLR